MVFRKGPDPFESRIKTRKIEIFGAFRGSFMEFEFSGAWFSNLTNFSDLI